jgi:hypothetical protein
MLNTTFKLILQAVLAIKKHEFPALEQEYRVKEIHISKQSTKFPFINLKNCLVALILVIVIALGILAIQLLPLNDGNQPFPPIQDDRLASDVAVSALEAFFQIDAKEGKEAWLNRLCLLSTENGCEFISAGSDVLWTKYKEAEVDGSAIVALEEKVAESDIEQVWKMNIILSAPLPGSNKLQDTAYVVVVNADNNWKFDRFLLKPEIDALLADRTVADSLATEQSWMK